MMKFVTVQKVVVIAVTVVAVVSLYKYAEIHRNVMFLCNTNHKGVQIHNDHINVIIKIIIITNTMKMSISKMGNKVIK